MRDGVTMEKVLVCYGYSGLRNDDSDIEAVNKHLEQGWTVKSITMAASKEYTNVVFVLEKA